jgi:hypothetical protein
MYVRMHVCMYVCLRVHSFMYERMHVTSEGDVAERVRSAIAGGTQRGRCRIHLSDIRVRFVRVHMCVSVYMCVSDIRVRFVRVHMCVSGYYVRVRACVCINVSVYTCV